MELRQHLADALYEVTLAYEFGGGIDFGKKPEHWKAIAGIFIDEKKKGNGTPKEGVQDIPLGGGRSRRITRTALV